MTRRTFTRAFMGAAGALMAVRDGLAIGQPSDVGAPGADWSAELFDSSVSSRCWWYTPYDGGWAATRGAMADDAELRDIVEMEAKLAPVPEWAQRVVEWSINYVCPCGHCTFPRPQLEVLRDIGTETPPTFTHGCYCADGACKRAMMDYCLLLDAWHAGAPPDGVARELEALGQRDVDWRAVANDTWAVLGEHVEWRDLLVERILHQLRHAIKFTVWDDDPGGRFGRDEYVGDAGEPAAEGNPAVLFGHIERPVFGFDESSSPRVRAMEDRLAVTCPVGIEWGKRWIEEWWLCAPKAFRYLERRLWYVGQGTYDHAMPVPTFLQCEDTYPNHDRAAVWFSDFTTALDGWWRGAPVAGDVAGEVGRLLGPVTDTKRWLVRLYLRKLRRLVENGEQFTSLVDPQHTHLRGTAPLNPTL